MVQNSLDYYDYVTDDVKKVIGFLNTEMGKNIPGDSGIGIKPVSITNTKNLVRRAIKYAIRNNRKNKKHPRQQKAQ